jgi:hypothetical protein
MGGGMRRQPGSEAQSYGAPPAGAAAAGPRPDLRGHRLGVKALVQRLEDGVERRALLGLVVGFVAGSAIGTATVVAGGSPAVGIVVAIVLDVAIATWLPIFLVDPADRRLFRVWLPVAQDTMFAWRRAYGSEPFPRRDEDALLWLAARPPSTDPDQVDLEGSMLLALGRYAEASERYERLPTNTPWWRFTRAMAMARLEFEQGMPGDLDPARRAAAEVHGIRARAPIAIIALEDSVRAMIRGDDWDPPLRAVASHLGSSLPGIIAWGVGRWRTASSRLAASAIAAGLLVAAIVVES